MMKPPYKNEQGQYYLAALFHEPSLTVKSTLKPIKPVFCLQHSKNGLISARDTFVAMGDLTGYKWAVEYLGEWNHFEVLMRTKWFSQAYDIWCKELKMKMKSEAVDKIREISLGDGAQALGAAKYLADLSMDKSVKGRGRPSKEEVSGALKQAVQAVEAESADMARIGLRVVS